MAEAWTPVLPQGGSTGVHGRGQPTAEFTGCCFLKQRVPVFE